MPMNSLKHSLSPPELKLMCTCTLFLFDYIFSMYTETCNNDRCLEIQECVLEDLLSALLRIHSETSSLLKMGLERKNMSYR